jgi:tripartite-type tricarboxylate transporter receptor subunit TctC
MLVVDSSFVVNPSLYKKVPYDPYQDFEPVSLAVTTTQVLTVNPSLPVYSAKDLVSLVRANSGKYSYASAGIGTPGHLAGELFRLSLDLDLVHIPFSGAGPAIASTVGGHTPIASGSPASTIAQVKDGKLRALAVATSARLPALPDVPTMAEAGFPGIECDVWVGVLIPAGTPQDIVIALNRAVVDIDALPEVKERLTAFGFEPFAVTLENSPARIKAEGAKWAKVIREAGIKAE